MNLVLATWNAIITTAPAMEDSWYMLYMLRNWHQIDC